MKCQRNGIRGFASHSHRQTHAKLQNKQKNPTYGTKVRDQDQVKQNNKLITNMMIGECEV